MSSRHSSIAPSSYEEAVSPESAKDSVRYQGSRSASEAVAQEASKGYGLLWVGLKNPMSAEGQFSDELNGIASEFNSAIALVIARGERAELGSQQKFKILVPVSGTQSARFAAELTTIIARSNRGKVTVLYVTDVIPKGKKQTRGEKNRGLQREKAVLQDIAQLGKRHGVKIEAIVHNDAAPRDAILRELQDGDYDTIIMGVEPRQGEALFFGATAEAVATRAKQSVVLVSSPRYGEASASNDEGKKAIRDAKFVN